ncbi:MS4A1, partial [Cervus elaphus hippelaphus]
ESEGDMATPRNSVVGAFPAEGPPAMHAAQKGIPRRAPAVVGPTQSFFMREAKALGAVQIMNGLFHIALGSLMLIHKDVYMPICVTLWYPLWGGIMYIISGSLLAAAEKNSTQSMARRVIMNSLSLFAAISGIIFLIMDIFNMTISHFFKMENLNLIKTQMPYININNCERANPDENNSHNFAVMMIFAFLQKLVTAGTVENEWKKICSRPKANIILLSAEEKKEQAIEIKEEVVEQTEVAEQIEMSSLPKNEEDIEIIPVQEEEEEEAEMNFPEPPQDQGDSPIEND